TGSAALELSG
ncbi:hypothetical protein EE612_052131, partial [Oryza sativa]